MYCGPVRHDATREQPVASRLDLVFHVTGHAPAGPEALGIHQTFRALVEDGVRSAGLCRDVVTLVGYYELLALTLRVWRVAAPQPRQGAGGVSGRELEILCETAFRSRGSMEKGVP